MIRTLGVCLFWLLVALVVGSAMLGSCSTVVREAYEGPQMSAERESQEFSKKTTWP